MAIVLTDDGSMDTVLQCSECGKEFRFYYPIDAEPDRRKMDPREAYDEWVEEIICETAAEHGACLDTEEDDTGDPSI